jgi:hypothetical protein
MVKIHEPLAGRDADGFVIDSWPFRDRFMPNALGIHLPWPRIARIIWQQGAYT